VDALEAAAARYAAANPQSRRLHGRAEQAMPGGNTRTVLHFDPFPLYIGRSDGAYVWDVDGHRYLDILGEYSAGLLGHRDERVVASIVAAADRGVVNGGCGEAEIAFSRAISLRFPSMEQLRFCNSGTEANLYAISLAKAATGRTKLLCFSGAYHGGVFIFAAGGNAMNAPFDWTICRYNDVAAAKSAIAELGTELAAVIVEPMLSNGGCIPARPEFLAALREGCDQTGALLIFDEIVTSRHGPAGVQGLVGIQPDLTTLGKYLGGGLALGVFGGRAAIMELMNPQRADALPHAGTFNNNTIALSAGLTGLCDIFTPQRAQALFDEGEALRGTLNDLAAQICPAVQFTGMGSTMNLHFAKGPINAPEDLGHESRALFRLFHLGMLERGLYAAPRGQFNLSLPMGPEDFAFIARQVGAFLEQFRDDIVRLVGAGE
jgi:glutamate-1-semialdehyde 2,1-aminomutase